MFFQIHSFRFHRRNKGQIPNSVFEPLKEVDIINTFTKGPSISPQKRPKVLKLISKGENTLKTYSIFKKRQII